jgi:DNA-directed RNA polymerase specialized sigma24 family protein
MVTDVGDLYGSLAGRLQQIVGKQIHARSVVVEDACQFAWSRLVLHAARIDHDTVLQWLARTALREAVKLDRRDQRELSLEAEIQRGEQQEPASAAPGPLEQVEVGETLALVRRLRPRQQRYLMLQAAGYSYEEIMSREPGLTRRTLERQITRGRERLRAAA